MPKRKVEADKHPEMLVFPAFADAGGKANLTRLPVGPSGSFSDWDERYDSAAQRLFIYRARYDDSSEAPERRRDSAWLYVYEQGRLQGRAACRLMHRIDLFEGLTDGAGNAYFGSLVWDRASGNLVRLPYATTRPQDGADDSGVAATRAFADSLMRTVKTCFAFSKKPERGRDLYGETLLCNFPGPNALIVYLDWSSIDTTLANELVAGWHDPRLKPIYDGRRGSLFSGDDDGLTQTDEAVVKNEPHKSSGGNHMVGDPFFGHEQLYLHYYSLAVPGGGTITFKACDTVSTVKVLSTPVGVYIKEWQRTEDKTAWYFLTSK